jgi:hypothetical protein
MPGAVSRLPAVELRGGCLSGAPARLAAPGRPSASSAPGARPWQQRAEADTHPDWLSPAKKSLLIRRSKASKTPDWAIVPSSGKMVSESIQHSNALAQLWHTTLLLRCKSFSPQYWLHTPGRPSRWGQGAPSTAHVKEPLLQGLRTQVELS